MKAFIFTATSAAHAVVVYGIYLAIHLQCGLGPDGPAACNHAADRQAFSFAVGAIVFYAILSFAYWRQLLKSKS